MGLTAQDQQSRAEFEAHMRKLSPCVRLYRHTCDGGDKYRTVTVQRNWELWQAARALPARGVDPMLDTPAGLEPDFFLDGGTLPCFYASTVQAMGRVPPGWQPVPVEPTGEMLLAIMSSGEVDVLRETPEKHQVLLIDRAGIPDRYTALLAAAPRPPAAQESTPLIARQLGEWHEDDGAVSWWAWCGREWAGEPAWVGTPNSSDWPGYHTHWTPHPEFPAEPGTKATP